MLLARIKFGYGITLSRRRTAYIIQVVKIPLKLILLHFLAAIMKWFCNITSNVSTTTAEMSIPPPKANRAYLLRLKKSGNCGLGLTGYDDSCHFERRMETNNSDRGLGVTIPVLKTIQTCQSESPKLPDRIRNDQTFSTHTVKNRKKKIRILPELIVKNERANEDKSIVGENLFQGRKVHQTGSEPQSKDVSKRKQHKGNQDTLTQEEESVKVKYVEYRATEANRQFGRRSFGNDNKMAAIINTPSKENLHNVTFRKLPIPQKRVDNEEWLSTFIVPPRVKQANNTIKRSAKNKRQLPKTPSTVSEYSKTNHMPSKIKTPTKSNENSLQTGNLKFDINCFKNDNLGFNDNSPENLEFNDISPKLETWSIDNYSSIQRATVKEIIQDIEKTTKSLKKNSISNHHRSAQRRDVPKKVGEPRKPRQSQFSDKPEVPKRSISRRSTFDKGKDKSDAKAEFLNKSRIEKSYNCNKDEVMQLTKAHDSAISEDVDENSSLKRRSDSYTLSIYTDNLLDEQDEHKDDDMKSEECLKKHDTLANISSKERPMDDQCFDKTWNKRDGPRNKGLDKRESAQDTRTEKQRNCPCLGKAQNYRLEFFSKAVVMTPSLITCITCQQSYHNTCVNLTNKQAELMMSHDIPYTCVVCLSERLSFIHTIKEKLNDIVGEPLSGLSVDPIVLKTKEEEKIPLTKQMFSCKNITKFDDENLNKKQIIDTEPVVVATTETDKQKFPNKEDHNGIIDKLITTLATRNDFRRFLRVNSLTYRVKKNKENYMWDEFC